MSTATATLIPRRPIVPSLLPRLPQAYPCAVPHASFADTPLLARRDIYREMDDLSEEETELEEIIGEQTKRGFSWYVPMGRHFTQQEEKADEQADEDEDDESQSAQTVESGEEEESEADLDADMDDMDDGGHPSTDETTFSEADL